MARAGRRVASAAGVACGRGALAAAGRHIASAAGAFALSAALALTMTPAAAFVGVGGAGEAHAATTSALEGSPAAAAQRVSQDMALTGSAAGAPGDEAQGAPQITSGTYSIGGDEFTSNGYRFRTLGGDSLECALVGIMAGADVASGDASASPLAIPEHAYTADGLEYDVTELALDGADELADVAVLSVPATVRTIAEGALAALPSLETVRVEARDGAQALSVNRGAFAEGQAASVAVAVVGGDFDARAEAWRAAGVGNVVDVAQAAGKTAFVPAVDEEAAADFAADAPSDGGDAGAGPVLYGVGGPEDGDGPQDGWLYTLREDGMLDVEWQGEGDVPEGAVPPGCAEVDGVVYTVSKSSEETSSLMTYQASAIPSEYTFKTPRASYGEYVGGSQIRLLTKSGNDLHFRWAITGQYKYAEYPVGSTRTLTLDSPRWVDSGVSCYGLYTSGSFSYSQEGGVLSLIRAFSFPNDTNSTGGVFYAALCAWATTADGSIDTAAKWYTDASCASDKLLDSMDLGGEWVEGGGFTDLYVDSPNDRGNTRTVKAVSNSDVYTGAYGDFGYKTESHREYIGQFNDGANLASAIFPAVDSSFYVDRDGSNNPIYVRNDGKGLGTAIYTDTVTVSPRNLAAKLFTGEFGSGTTMYPEDTLYSTGTQLSGEGTFEFDGGNPNESGRAARWTMPACAYAYGAHTFGGWRASYTSPLTGQTVTHDVPVPAGYTQGKEYEADLTEVFRMIARAGTASGNTGNTVTFTPIWIADNATYHVYLCDYPDDFSDGKYKALVANGGLAIDGSSTFHPIAELPAGTTHPTDAKYFATYTYSRTSAITPVPETSATGTSVGYGYAYKPGYAFSGWEIRGDATDGWNGWKNTPVASGSTKPIGNVATSGTERIGAGVWGDVALWPKLVEKEYTVTYHKADDAKIEGAAATTGTEAFKAREILRTGGKGLANLVGSTADAAYAFKFRGWSPVEPAGQGFSPVTGQWGENSATSRIWKTLTEDAWNDIWVKEGRDGHNSNDYTSKVDLYDVWSSADTMPVNLGQDEPYSIRATNEDDEYITRADGTFASIDAEDDYVAPGQVKTLYMWGNRGLVSRPSSADSSLAAPSSAPDGIHIVGDECHDAEGPISFVANIDESKRVVMDAPTRYGYEFMGWGVTDVDSNGKPVAGATKALYDEAEQKAAEGGPANTQYVREHPEQGIYSTLYIRMTEPANGDSPAKFEITNAGAKVIADWKKPGDHGDKADWVAVWRACEYDVSLRVAKSAVQAAELSPLWLTAADASAGWLYYYNRYPYWHTVDIPKYREIASTFTYEGWYASQVGVERLASGSADDTNKDLAAGAPNKFTPGANIVVGEGSAAVTYTGTGRLMGADGASAYRVTQATMDATNNTGNIWLRHRAVQIGVTTPIGETGFADLCAVEGDEAYAVGTSFDVGVDGRELLEAPITFITTGQTSHDLYVSDVEFTTDYYERDKDGNVVLSGGTSGDPVLNKFLDEEGKPLKKDNGNDFKGTYLAHQLLANNDDYVMGKDEDGADIPNDKRYFWLSADKTVDYGQAENWAYSVDKTKEAGGESLDRVYFGIEEAGAGANNVLSGSDADMAKRLESMKLCKPNGDGTDAQAADGHGKYNYTRQVMKAELDAEGNPVKNPDGTDKLVPVDGAYERVNTFWYGLDLRKCHIDPVKVREYAALDGAGAGAEWAPRLGKLKFTFDAFAREQSAAAAETAAR